MSEANVEVVRALWDAWIRGDRQTAFSYNSPTVTFTFEEGFGLESSYEGPALRRFYDEFLDLFAEFETGVDEIIAAPDGRVLVFPWLKGKGHGSGVPVHLEWAEIFTLSDGKVTRCENYRDRDEARATAGLAE